MTQEATNVAPTKKAKKEVVRTDVVLTTGETLSFPGVQKMMKSDSLADGEATVRFAFRNGEVREFVFGKHAPLLMRLAIHGARQKIGDEAAGIEDVEDMVEAVDSMIRRLEAGEWGAERQAGNSFAGASIVIRAVAEVRGSTIDEAKAFIEKKIAHYAAKGTPITRQAFYAQLRVPGSPTAAIIARLEAEKTAKAGAKVGVTAASLLEDDDAGE